MQECQIVPIVTIERESPMSEVRTDRDYEITLEELRRGDFDQELTDLWQLSAISPDADVSIGRLYGRLNWSASQFARAHPGTPSARAYKRLSDLTVGYGW